MANRYTVSLTGLMRELMYVYIPPTRRAQFLIQIDEFCDFFVDAISRGGFIAGYVIEGNDRAPIVPPHRWDDFCDFGYAQLLELFGDNLSDNLGSVMNRVDLSVMNILGDVDYKDNSINMIVLEFELDAKPDITS